MATERKFDIDFSEMSDIRRASFCKTYLANLHPSLYIDLFNEYILAKDNYKKDLEFLLNSFLEEGSLKKQVLKYIYKLHTPQLATLLRTSTAHNPLKKWIFFHVLRKEKLVEKIRSNITAYDWPLEIKQAVLFFPASSFTSFGSAAASNTRKFLQNHKLILMREYRLHKDCKEVRRDKLRNYYTVLHISKRHVLQKHLKEELYKEYCYNTYRNPIIRFFRQRILKKTSSAIAHIDLLFNNIFNYYKIPIMFKITTSQLMNAVEQEMGEEERTNILQRFYAQEEMGIKKERILSSVSSNGSFDDAASSAYTEPRFDNTPEENIGTVEENCPPIKYIVQNDMQLGLQQYIDAEAASYSSVFTSNNKINEDEIIMPMPDRLDTATVAVDIETAMPSMNPIPILDEITENEKKQYAKKLLQLALFNVPEIVVNRKTQEVYQWSMEARGAPATCKKLTMKEVIELHAEIAASKELSLSDLLNRVKQHTKKHALKEQKSVSPSVSSDSSTLPKLTLAEQFEAEIKQDKETLKRRMESDRRIKEAEEYRDYILEKHNIPMLPQKERQEQKDDVKKQLIEKSIAIVDQELIEQEIDTREKLFENDSQEPTCFENYTYSDTEKTTEGSQKALFYLHNSLDKMGSFSDEEKIKLQEGLKDKKIESETQAYEKIKTVFFKQKRLRCEDRAINNLNNVAEPEIKIMSFTHP